VSADTASPELRNHFKHGLDAPICLTWEITYGCNLACAHCLSTSGKRDPRELSTEECRHLIDEMARMRVFYVNVGGGEPLVRRDFLDLVDHAVERKVGVKFSTNGALITPEAARRIAATDYLDVQISIDGATPETNDPVRGRGSYALARRGMDRLAEAGFDRHAGKHTLVGADDDIARMAHRHFARFGLGQRHRAGESVAHSRVKLAFDDGFIDIRRLGNEIDPGSAQHRCTRRACRGQDQTLTRRGHAAARAAGRSRPPSPRSSAGSRRSPANDSRQRRGGPRAPRTLRPGYRCSRSHRCDRAC